MATLTSDDLPNIESTVQTKVESDLLNQITNGSLPNDVFNMLTNGDNNYFLECAPTGASAAEIQTYNVPINSEYTEESARLDIYKTLVNLCLVIIFMIITYFTVPVFYKYGIVDVINKMFEDQDKDYDKRIHRIASVDIYLSLWMIGLILYFLAMAFVEGLWASYIFVVLLIVYILSVVVVDGKKKEDEFMTTLLPGQHGKFVSTIYKVSDSDKIDYFKNVDIFDLFFSFWKDAFTFIMGGGDLSKKDSNNQAKKQGLPLVPIIWFTLLSVYYGSILISYYLFSAFDLNTFKRYCWEYPIFVIFPTIIYFCLFFDVGTEYRRRHAKVAAAT